jgi:DNA repair protein RadA/Sms
MAKTKVVYVCKACNQAFPRWEGRCPNCGAWNTLAERVEQPVAKGKPQAIFQVADAANQPLSIPQIASKDVQRIPVPVGEFNHTLGGGLVPGSVVLIGGDPGIGKSTLLLQIAALLSEREAPILYISGEESVHQIKLRADRLGIQQEGLYLLAETNLSQILAHIERMQPHAVIVDSIQSVFLDSIDSSAGSIKQVRECASGLLQVAKARRIPMFLVGHVTKSGNIAGPRVLEHMVDTVLYLEGERFHSYRLLRSVKNRFGSTNEVGVFEMNADGMREIKNPSEAFLSERLVNAAGSAIAVTLEGTRPLLVEIQALTSQTSFGLPRRTANGVEFNRLLLLVAVLTKRVGINLGNQDVFVNVVGGLRISEPAVDLAVAVATASSFKNKPVASDLAIVGEIGLSGELRSVTHIERRLNEALKLGFERCLLPSASLRRKEMPAGIETIGVRSLSEALEVALAG